jgi:hypothetical protein
MPKSEPSEPGDYDESRKHARGKSEDGTNWLAPPIEKVSPTIMNVKYKAGRLTIVLVNRWLINYLF